MMQQEVFLQGGVGESFSLKASVNKRFPSPLLCLMSPPMAGIELEALWLGSPRCNQSRWDFYASLDNRTSAVPRVIQKMLCFLSCYEPNPKGFLNRVEWWGLEIREIFFRAKRLKFWPKEALEFFSLEGLTHPRSGASRKSIGFGIRETKVQILALSLISCGTLSEMA